MLHYVLKGSHLIVALGTKAMLDTVKGDHQVCSRHRRHLKTYFRELEVQQEKRKFHETDRL